MKTFTTILAVSAACLLLSAYTTSKDYLKQCWEQQVKPVKGQFLQVHYRENRNSTYHSPEPWMTLNSQRRGNIWCNTEQFSQLDTVIGKENKFLVSRALLNKDEYLSKPYWNENVSVSKKQFEHINDFARYSPVMLIDMLNGKNLKPDLATDNKFAIYTYSIDGNIITLYIRVTDGLLEKAVVTQNHDILGDVTTTFAYNDYSTMRKLSFPKNISVMKVHGIVDEVNISSAAFMQQPGNVLEKPKDYVVKDNSKTPSVEIRKLREHAYTLNLPQAESQAGLIEFNDFLVVFDAPLNSGNGELIIKEANRLFPNKPIRYFAFGHHHPWYIGGVRAFIHHGTKIISVGADIPYLQFIADAPHTIKPDSLFKFPKPLLVETLDSHMTITDGKMKLEIYHIGMKSGHTNDYLIFYIPSEKLVFEGDLVWVPKKGDITKAGQTQVGFYKAVKELKLDVDTVIQTWPTDAGRDVKHTIPFSDIEKSVNMP